MYYLRHRYNIYYFLRIFKINIWQYIWQKKKYLTIPWSGPTVFYSILCYFFFFFNFLIFWTLWGLNPNSLNLRTHHQPLSHRGHDDHQQNITFYTQPFSVFTFQSVYSTIRDHLFLDSQPNRCSSRFSLLTIRIYSVAWRKMYLETVIVPPPSKFNWWISLFQ